MRAYLETQGDGIWDVVENDMFIPTCFVNGVDTSKIKSVWNEDDKKRVIYAKKAKNMLQSTLGMD